MNKDKNDSIIWFALVVVAVSAGSYYSVTSFRYVEMGPLEWIMTALFGALSSVFAWLMAALVGWFVRYSVEDENIERVRGVIVELVPDEGLGDYDASDPSSGMRLRKAAVDVGGEVHKFRLYEKDFRRLCLGDPVITYLRIRSSSPTTVEAIEKE